MPNALIDETSPYLLQHAHNPVDWLPWGDAAFARARAEDKLVFLSVGYSTCHWCHVMEHESFEDERVAAVLNRHFVNVKVDREERPDVDAAYMAFVQATSGHGGWPMSVWLTPDGLPVVGGTYFPPHDRGGRVGLTRLCEEVALVWREDRPRLVESGQRVIEHLRALLAPRPSRMPGTAAFGEFVAACERIFDETHGGFGEAPKFPRPVVPRMLLQLSERFAGRAEAESCRRMVFATLRAMAAGGIRDHLGGGFHRYSVDRWWHVPHFEKMLYDQAQLAALYLEAWQAGGGAEMRDVAEGVFDYVLRELRDPAGGFHAAEDADSLEHEGASRQLEGAFWTWRARQIHESLEPRAAAWFASAYGLAEAGNARPASDPHGELAGRNTLARVVDDAELARRFGVAPQEITASLADSRARLLAIRNLRPRPHRDDKVVAAWNGLLLGALARGAQVLGRGDLATAAGALAGFLRAHMWDGRELRRTWRGGKAGGPAFAADYAGVIHGLIEWHGASGDAAALDFAADLQQAMERCCRAPDRPGYVMRAAAGGNELLVIEDDHDGAEPAAGHLAAENLLRLAVLLEEPRWELRARELLQGAAAVAAEHPFAAPVLIRALDLLERGVVKVEVRGEPEPALAAALRTAWLPRAVWTRTTGHGEVIVCRDGVCHPPTRSAAGFAAAAG